MVNGFAMSEICSTLLFCWGGCHNHGPWDSKGNWWVSWGNQRRRLDASKNVFNFNMISNKMVSIAIMVGGAIINATAFVGGRYLARVFDWWIWFRWREKPTRTRLVKIFHAAYEKYEENRTKLLDWISTNNDRIKDEAKQNFRHTGYALKH